MPLEIEKKYRLTKTQRRQLLSRLADIDARFIGEEFEENILYSGHGIDPGQTVLRLRRIGGRTKLTYKKRFPSKSLIKHQLEEETEVLNAEATDAILKGLGFKPAIVYEKRRLTWLVGEAEIVVDDLPFGLFMEIEAKRAEIRRVEKVLALKGLRAESETYPYLAAKHGKRRDTLIEARFGVNNSPAGKLPKRQNKT
jgi:adenylate cyclase, class 2